MMYPESGQIMRKRQKLVLTAVILTLGMWGMQMTPIEWRYILTASLAGVSWLMSSWSLKDGLSKVEWLTVPLPMALFSAAVGLFYILLPQYWWARLLIILLFGVGQYALLLTANIFSVAAIRTIALFRAASAVGFVMTLLTGFLMYNTILSFRLQFWFLGIWVFLVSFLLLLPSLWSVNLETKVTRNLFNFTMWLSILMGFMGMAIAFWPISIAVASLFLSTMLYVVLGISQHHFSQRLFKRTVTEYLTVGAVVLVTMLLTSGSGV